MFRVPEKYRIKEGLLASSERYGNNGVFMIRSIKFKQSLKVIASDGMGWEHVSVSLPNRCPTWEEMCFIKDIFWEPQDFVVQIHPIEDDYINNHPYCLHLWRRAETNDYCEKPPSILVGKKTGI